MTRRLFASILAGGATAMASTTGFVKHTVLRRPYRAVQTVPPKSYMLWDCLYVTLECKDPVRVTAKQEGNPESVLEATVVPRSGEQFMLLGLHQCRAEVPTTITFESKQAFKLLDYSAKFMHPSFSRIDDMIVYNDPFYKPHPETIGFGIGPPVIHRKLYGPGKDVGY